MKRTLSVVLTTASIACSGAPFTLTPSETDDLVGNDGEASSSTGVRPAEDGGTSSSSSNRPSSSRSSAASSSSSTGEKLFDAGDGDGSGDADNDIADSPTDEQTADACAPVTVAPDNLCAGEPSYYFPQYYFYAPNWPTSGGCQDLGVEATPTQCQCAATYSCACLLADPTAGAFIVSHGSQCEDLSGAPFVNTGGTPASGVGCSPDETVIVIPSGGMTTGPFNTLSPICVEYRGEIPGWQTANGADRLVTVTGASVVGPTSASSGGETSPASDGWVYWNFTGATTVTYTSLTLL